MPAGFRISLHTLFPSRAELESGQRINLLDDVRGLFLTWMVLGHVGRLVGLPPDHPLWWFRLGSVVECFVMLTGLSISWIYRWKEATAARSAAQLRRRARQLGVIAYVSNLLLATLRDGLQGQFSVTHVWRIATFQDPWTISAILLPTTAFLLLAPMLLRLSAPIRAGRLLALFTLVITATSVFVDCTSDAWGSSELYAALFGSSRLFSFPLLLLLLYSFWSFGLGRVIRENHSPPRAMMLFVGVSVVVHLLLPHIAGPAHLVIPPARLMSRFGLSGGIAALAAALPPLLPLRSYLALLGRSSLLVFLTHRLLLQGSLRLFVGFLDGDLLVLVALALTYAGCGSLCVARERWEPLGRRLRAIGL